MIRALKAALQRCGFKAIICLLETRFQSEEAVEQRLPMLPFLPKLLAAYDCSRAGALDTFCSWKSVEAE